MNIRTSGVQLEVLHTAEIPTPYHYVFRAPGSRAAQLRAGFGKKGPTLQSPCLAYVVRHRDIGVLLIDTGLHPDATTNPRKDFGLVMSRVFSELKPAETPYVDQLRSAGVEPDEVALVLMTHLHLDHTSAMRLLPNATFICTLQEWRAATGRFATANGYRRRHLPPEARVQLLDFAKHGEPYDVFTQTIDLAGDGSIRVILTPGHTPGHQSVLLQLQDGGDALLVGDAAYTVRSIREQLLPMLTANDSTSLASLRELKAFAETHPETALVPSHDPEAWRQLSRDPRAAAAPRSASET